MDGLVAIGQRIAEIQSLVADPALALSGSAATASGTSSSAAFAATLAQALAADGTTSASGSSSDVLGESSGTSGVSTASILSALGLSSGASSTADLLSGLGLSSSAASSSSLLAALSGSSGTSSSTSTEALLEALGLTGVSSSSSAARTTSGTVNSAGIPTDLAAYGNGHIPASALEPVGATGSSMWAPAAESLERLIAAAKADGVSIGVTEGYRSYDEQVTLTRTKGLYSEGGLAAVPGTSEHGWGMAADLKLDSTALAWMRENAADYGFYATAPRESWHWAYSPGS